jgi:hypothetical protein
MATTTRRRPAAEPAALTPIFAVVGATDFAVEHVRNAQAQAQRAVSDFNAQEVPTRVVATALEAASKAEAGYEDLARRGRKLVSRVRRQRSTQDFLQQASNTISRTRGAVTSARRAADGTSAALLDTIYVGRREAASVAASATRRADSAASTTQRSARKTAGTVKRTTTTAKSQAKGARTTAAKATTTGARAAKSAATKVGD